MKIETDIVVVGGGPAGICAAIAAARSGARTLLIERYGFLGGMSTAALVYPWMTYHTKSGVQVIKGIAQEIVDRLMKLNASPGHLRDTVGFTHTITPYNGEVFKVLVMDMLREAGAEILLHSFVDKVHTENGHIQSVETVGKSSRITVEGKVFIDTTGDADLAYLSGAHCLKGREGDQLTQPMTVKFRMRGVDLAKVKQYILDHPSEFSSKTPFDELPQLPLTAVSGFRKQWEKANLPINRNGVLMFTGPSEDEVLINMTRVQGLDGTNVFDLTKAEEEGRKQVLMLAEFFRNLVPGFEKASISQVGAQIGVRESRRLDGVYSLTMDDVIEGRKFEDCIARSGYPIDIHDPKGKGIVAHEVNGDGAYDIPYRCLLPKNIDNLLVGGRCISTTHEALGTTRLTPSCMATGQAAGTGAAIAFKEGKSPQDIDVQQLRDALLCADVILS